MLIKCSKGCGVAIHVTQEALEETTKLGMPLDVAHEVCPRDQSELPKYRVVIQVFRISPGAEPEMIASNGAVVEAPSFSDASPILSKKLSEQWVKVLEMQHVIDIQN